MIILISPAKTLDFEFDTPEFLTQTEIAFPKEASQLMSKLKKLKPSELSKLMNISSKLAEQNYTRNQEWIMPFGEFAKPALLAFKGEVYVGMNAQSFDSSEHEYVQKHLRILSGLYGIIKPNDLILPYRLEMGTALQMGKNKNLYEFWGNKITQNIKSELEQVEDKTLINLASNEYFKSVKTNLLKCRIITPEFKDFHNGGYKIITFFAKKARGMMVRFLATNKISNVEEMKLFDTEGYYFNDALSSENKWVFTRG